MNDLDMRMSGYLLQKNRQEEASRKMLEASPIPARLLREIADAINRVEESPVMIKGRAYLKLSFEMTVPLPEGPLPTPEFQKQSNCEAWSRIKAELPSMISWHWLEALQPKGTQQ